MTDTITCPNCGAAIDVSETLTSQLREHLRDDFEKEAKRKDAALQKRLEELREQANELATARRSLEEEVAARVAQAETRLHEEARTKAKEAIDLEIRDLQGQLSDAKVKITAAQQAELQLRKERRALEDKQQELELTVSRTLDGEREKIRAATKLEADEQHRLDQAERDQLIADLRDQIDDLKRRSEKGSPQTRGEVMELELEDVLRNAFPDDTIEPVPVGAHGGDILQRVHDQTGLDCGVILWESKRTKNWNDTWLPKLRNDQRTARAQMAILTSEELPKGVVHFTRIDGVWVTSRPCLVGVAVALRQGMIEAARTRRSLEGRKDKVEVLYNYLAGSQFGQRVEGIVEAFMTLKDDLESEKRSMHRLWAKREKQLERAAINTSGLYGDLAGILGSNMPQIANLEIAAITAADDLLQPASPEESCF